MPFNKTTASEAGKRSSRAGTPNRATAGLKESLSDMLTGDISKIRKQLAGLTGREYLEVIVKLMPYVLPKQSQVQNVVDVSQLTDDEIDAMIDRIAQKSQSND